MSNPNHIHQWNRGCLRKKRYRTTTVAFKVADKVKKERGTSLHVYYCKNCLGFHLTKSDNHPAEIARVA